VDKVLELAKRLGAKLKQTHTSWVLLLDDVVYKIKKPVNFGFLDYSTPQKRKEMCEREVLLNRRLCPSVYLGVVPVSEREGRLVLESDENVVDWAVKMKRIPDESILSNRLERVKEEDIRRVARRVARFHEEARRADEFGKLSVMKFNTDENFSQTERFVGETISREDYEFIKERTNGFYERHGDIFEKRIKEGKVRDGHGDIRLEHVAFLGDEVCIFDCIEFNERFRCGDVLNDMCFLSTELEFLGKDNLARAYEEEYVRQTQDKDARLLLPFFKCYRAYVRGKVHSFMLEDPSIGEEEKREAKEKARGYFRLARRYAEGIP